MADDNAQQILALALRLHRVHPLVPALEVLDLVMKLHRGGDLSFDAAEGLPARRCV
ncbi:hypothetical protein [Aquincola tertiaricarbonis]|uniref:hypothetical protein n=1 Tax=Aquincola tertiaricarbonis TaxID=391953 RepID=UPI0018DE399B|nr:hypothetical protein [Aquincola tertiaricarbonis]